MIRSTATLLLTLAVSGCQEFLIVSVENPHSLHPVFSFRSRVGWAEAEAVKINTLTVTLREEGTPERVVWQIEAQSARVTEQLLPQPAALREVEYGTAPAGFLTIVKARPLVPGKRYRVISALRLEGKEGVAGAVGEFLLALPGTGGQRDSEK